MAKKNKTVDSNVESEVEDMSPVQNPDFSGVDLSNFESIPIGFAPFWRARPGAKFLAVIDSFDTRDPKFNRIILVSKVNGIQCHRGPVEGGEDVVVNKDETFNISVWDALDEPFYEAMMLQIKHGIDIPILVEAVEKKKGGQGTFWTFDVQMNKDQKKMLAAAKADREHRDLMADYRAMRMLNKHANSKDKQKFAAAAKAATERLEARGQLGA